MLGLFCVAEGALLLLSLLSVAMGALVAAEEALAEDLSAVPKAYLENGVNESEGREGTTGVAVGENAGQTTLPPQSGRGGHSQAVGSEGPAAEATRRRLSCCSGGGGGGG